jgi:hypothetical protein
MKKFINYVQNLIVKHWGKLIVVFLIIGTIINYNDVKRGFTNGWKSLDNTNQSKIDLLSKKERIRDSRVKKLLITEYKFNLNNIDTNTKRIQQVEEYDTNGNILKSIFFFNNTDSLTTINVPQVNNHFLYQTIRGKDTLRGERIYNSENKLIEIVNYNKIGLKSSEQYKYKSNQLIQITQTDWNGNVISTTNNNFEDGLLVEQITNKKNSEQLIVKNKYSINNKLKKSYTVFINNIPKIIITEYYDNEFLIKRVEVNSNSNVKEKRTEIKYNKDKLKMEETIFENNTPILYYKYKYTL